MIRGLLVPTAVGLIACIGGWLVDGRALAQAWLVAVLCVALLPIGALAALATHGLTGGSWGDATRAVWRALAASLPLVLVAMLPLLLAVDDLFVWYAPAESLPDIVQAKRLYLNQPFFLLRWLLYAVMWAVMAWRLAVWGRGDQSVSRTACVLTLIGLLYSVTFFGFDWFLSLEPTFYTDVFGLWLVVTAAAAAMAVVMWLAGEASEAPRADLAGLWMAVLLGWAFLAFAQYIIVWSGNLPHEIGWYLHRGTPLWRPVSWLVFALLLGLPFWLLFTDRGRRSRAVLRLTATLVLAGSALQVAWWILPAFDDLSLHLLWLLPASLLALGGGQLALVRHRLSGAGS